MMLAAAVRQQVLGVDREQSVSEVRSMEQVVGGSLARPRFAMLLLALFSALALVLAAVGLYGVISYSVAQRTSEFGIRIAMGAGPRDVLGMVVGQGLRLGVIGVVLGGVGALALTRLIRGLLFGISSFDPQTFIAMALLLTGVTLVACYIPAHRATKVDPMVALRYE